MLLLVACTGLWSCASEEIPRYGAPEDVAGGVGGSGAGNTVGGGGTGGSTVSCEVNESCGVSFATDIFPVLDDPQMNGMSGCATQLCHGVGMGELTLTAGDAPSYYTALKAVALKEGGSYIVPCDPASSKILCNLKLQGSADNPNGECGTLMPIAPADAPTPADLQNIEEWITCGAPDN